MDIRNRHVAFLGSFHNPSVIFEQISVIYALPRLFVGSFTLVLPFFPTGTMERVRGRGGWGPGKSEVAGGRTQGSRCLGRQHLFVGLFTLVLPFCPTGTMEQVRQPEDSRGGSGNAGKR